MPTELKAAKPTVKLPKSLAACVDLLYTTQQARYAAQKELSKMEAVEAAIKARLIDELPVSQATGLAGRVALAQIKVKDVPTIEDDKKFYAYVKKNNAFDLLQRRLSAEAVELRWAAKKAIPGVGVFHAKKVSITKL